MPDPSKALFYFMPLVYDVLHEPGTAAEVRGLSRIARRFVTSKPSAARTWLEPACGTGRYLRAAARHGIRTIGFDLAPEMVTYAQSRVPSATIFRATMQRFARHIPKASVGFAFNMINTIRHLPSDRAMLEHFRDIARVLAPGGVYVVGISLTNYGNEIPTEDIWIGKRGAMYVRQVVQYLPPESRRGPRARHEACICHMTITKRSGKRVEEEDLDFTYHLRCYNLEQWYKLLERSPLRVLATIDERGKDLPPAEPGYSIFVLTAR